MIREYPLALVFGLSLALVTAGSRSWGQNTNSAISAQIDRILSDAFHSDAPGAAVLVMQRGNVVLRKGYGQADLELGVPVDPTHVFRICSITKQFTAVAILQLVEAGKIRLQDEIVSYVPDYPTGGKKVTLAYLLTHTSGIASIEPQQEWPKVWRQDMTVTQLLALTRDKPLDFAPGTDFKYSNTGYFLLGAVIEKASGQSYADYVQTHIFAPAGMTSSSYDMEGRIVSRRVRGYMRQGKMWGNAPYLSMTQPYSAGALLSTVDDLWKWEQALAAGKLVSPALLKKAYTQVQLPDGRGTNYGFGWELGMLGNHATVEHSGGMPGFTAHELRIADAGIYITILCNAYGLPDSPKNMARRIAKVVLNEPAPVPATVAAAALQDYAGAYRIAAGATFTISVENGKLVGQLGPGKRPLSATATDEFGAAGDDMRFAFRRDATDRVDRVEVHTDGPGPALVWPRVRQPVQ